MAPFRLQPGDPHPGSLEPVTGAGSSGAAQECPPKHPPCTFTMEKKPLECHYWALEASPAAGGGGGGQIPVNMGIKGISDYRSKPVQRWGSTELISASNELWD